jgi:hypothetical protein
MDQRAAFLRLLSMRQGCSGCNRPAWEIGDAEGQGVPPLAAESDHLAAALTTLCADKP